MAKSNIPQQTNELQDQLDSLVENNNFLTNQIDSLQQTISITRDSLQKMLSQDPSETASSISNYDWGTVLCLLFFIVIVGALSWGIWRLWRNVISAQYKTFMKRWWWVLPVAAVAVWIVYAYWSLLIVVLALVLIAYGAFNYFGKKKEKGMGKVDNYDNTMASSFSSVAKEEQLHAGVAASPCIAAVASDTRKVKNQDGFCEVYLEKYQARIIAIADGVGSSFNAEKGSRLVTTKAVELVKEAIEANETVNFNFIFDKIQINFDEIFDHIQSALDAKVESDYTDEHQLAELKPASYGTTLIIGIDLPDRFVAAYVGNGSIWHISGLFNTFPSAVCLPWNAVNLLKPDTIMSGGKEALYKIFFHKGEKKHHKPTVLQVSKLNESPGDIFILTTDGIYSSDHAIAAKDDEGEIWIPSTTQFSLLHDYLKAYVEGNEDLNDDTLKQLLVRYLAHIKETQIMDDDTTLGIFMSAEAKAHFMEERIKNETN